MLLFVHTHHMKTEMNESVDILSKTKSKMALKTTFRLLISV